MAKGLAFYEGVIRPGLVADLGAFRAQDRRASSYYLNFKPAGVDTRDGVRVAVKNVLAEELKRIEAMDLPSAERSALRHDWEQVQRWVPEVIGERHTLGVACFLCSEPKFSRAFSLPWPVRARAFFEDRFVLWPLRQLLEQADRYAVILTDREYARMFLYFFERIDEIADVVDAIPARVRFPDPLDQSRDLRKRIGVVHHHFEVVAEAGLRVFEKEPFQHLIIGGHAETLPEFEGHLHSYLRERIVARWKIDLHAPLEEIFQRTFQEEQHVLEGQARDIWQAIQDKHRARGAVGAEETFAALWARRVQALLTEPGVSRQGFRCTVCARLRLEAGPCVECGGRTTEVADVVEEAVHDAVDQAARVRFCKDPALKQVGSLAALRRY